MEHRLDPQRHIEDARASLLAHVGELGRRLRAARARFDLRGHIAANPLATVGVAFALGALLGLRGGGRRPRDARGELRRGARVGLAAVAMRVAKELALIGATSATRRWWEQRQASTEVRASYEPGVEPFLER